MSRARGRGRQGPEGGTYTMLREKPIATLSGWIMLPLVILAILAVIFWVVALARMDAPRQLWKPLRLFLAAALCAPGLFVVYPNEARAVLLFGTYGGTVKRPGFHWVNPFTTRPKVSLRVRNFESAKLKVNDHAGNP